MATNIWIIFQNLSHRFYSLYTITFSAPMNYIVYWVSRITIQSICTFSLGLFGWYWNNVHDWIKIPVMLWIQWLSFEMLISRKKLKNYLLHGLTMLLALVYMILSYSALSFPNEPELIVANEILEFNTTSIADCKVSPNALSCFGDGIVWYEETNWTVEYFADIQVGVQDVFEEFYAYGTFGIPRDEWDICVDRILKMLCGHALPLCDHSCQRVSVCTSLCEDALDICGERIRRTYEEYGFIMESLLISSGSTESDAAEIMGILAYAFNNCSGVFTNQSNTLCMTSDGYETSMESGPDGMCTSENGIAYLEYLESLNSVSMEEYNELINLYEIDFERKLRIRVLIAFGMLISIIILQVGLSLSPKLQDICYNGGYVTNYDTISLKGRLKVASLSLITGFLCYILHSVIISQRLQRYNLIICWLAMLFAALTTVRSLFSQDRIASDYIKYKKAHSGGEQKPKQKQAKSRLMEVFLLIVKMPSLLIKLYRKNFGKKGKYEYLKFVLSETTEISLQIKVMLGLIKTENTTNILLYASIISTNLAVTPVLLLSSSPILWRTLNRYVDSLLDLCYLFLLHGTLSSGNEDTQANTSDIVMGILFPSMRLTLRVFFFTRAFLGDDVKQHTSNQSTDQTGLPNTNGVRIKISKKARIALSILFISSGLSLLVSMFTRVFQKTQQCKNMIGEDIWNGFEEHIMFPDGLFGDISCNLASVNTLNLSDSGLAELEASVSFLHDLRVLDLSHNSLTTLPVTLIELKNLTSIILNNNDVSIELDWSGLGLEQYPNDFLNLIPTLQKLNLSRNSISMIDNVEDSALTSLESLDLSHNTLESISADYIRSMNSLEVLNLSMNQLRDVDESIWSMRNLNLLDVSYNLLVDVPSVWPSRTDGFLARVVGNNVTSIDWSWSGSGIRLFQVPDELSELHELTSLTAADQELIVYRGLIPLEKFVFLNLTGTRSFVGEDICTMKSLKTLDVSHGMEDTAYWLPECVNSVTTLYASGLESYMLCDEYSSITVWLGLEHLIADHLTENGCTEISSVLANLTSLRTLNASHSPITEFTLSPIPENLTFVDLRNTSMSLNQLNQSLPDFDCSSIPFLCTRVS